MVKYLELQTNIKIDNYNGYTNLYKSDILVIDDKAYWAWWVFTYKCLMRFYRL